MRRASSTRKVVPGPVPQTGVDVLEAVDVDEDHGEQPGHPAEAAEGAVEAVDQQRPVGQGSQGVEQGVAHELALIGLAGGQVPDEKREKRPPVVFGPHDGDFGGETAAVAGNDLHFSAHAGLVGPRRSSVHSLQDLGQPAVGTAGPLDQPLAHDLVPEPAEHRLRRRVPVGHHARLVYAYEGVRRRLHGAGTGSAPPVDGRSPPAGCG